MAHIRVSAFRWVPPFAQGLVREFRVRWALEEAGRFTAADLLMTTVLSILRHTRLVAEQPVLEAYHARCATRPAYQKAMADHLAPFARNAPPGA